MNDTDLTVLFGNLLENACEGCMTVPEDIRQIRLRGEMLNHGSYVFTIDNTFSGTVQIVKGQYLSSKHQGNGIGIQSVRNIVDNYNGLAKFETTDNMFCVSIVLNLCNKREDSKTEHFQSSLSTS